ncbi:MAG: chemotaxis protein CheW [Oceanospirillaceae bacterium]|nr:chemotaxis protein CheW [Oceanospirillaceae bacterium]
MEADAFNLTDAPENFQEVRHGFNVAGNHFLVPRALYSELVNKPRICPIPTTPNWFKGFINHRGETIPVYDLALLSGDHNSSGQTQRWVLLLDEQPYMAGILLDSPPVALVAPNALEDSSSAAFNEDFHSFLDGYIEHDGTEWAELDHRRFFSAIKERF